MTLKHIMITATALSIGAGAALASDDDYRRSADLPPRAEWMSIADLATRLESEGYKVREIEVEHGVYDVEMFDDNGYKVEGYFDLVTGERVKYRGYDD